MIEIASDTGSFVSVNTRIRFLRAFDTRHRNLKTSCSSKKRMQEEKRRGYQGWSVAGPNRICALSCNLARSLIGVLEQEW